MSMQCSPLVKTLFSKWKVTHIFSYSHKRNSKAKTQISPKSVNVVKDNRFCRFISEVLGGV